MKKDILSQPESQENYSGYINIKVLYFKANKERTFRDNKGVYSSRRRNNQKFNTVASKYITQKLIDLQGKKRKLTIMVRDFKTTLKS